MLNNVFFCNFSRYIHPGVRKSTVKWSDRCWRSAHAHQLAVISKILVLIHQIVQSSARRMKYEQIGIRFVNLLYSIKTSGDLNTIMNDLQLCGNKLPATGLLFTRHMKMPCPNLPTYIYLFCFLMKHTLKSNVQIKFEFKSSSTSEVDLAGTCLLFITPISFSSAQDVEDITWSAGKIKSSWMEMG